MVPSAILSPVTDRSASTSVPTAPAASSPGWITSPEIRTGLETALVRLAARGSVTEAEEEEEGKAADCCAWCGEEMSATNNEHEEMITAKRLRSSGRRSLCG